VNNLFLEPRVTPYIVTPYFVTPTTNYYSNGPAYMPSAPPFINSNPTEIIISQPQRINQEIRFDNNIPASQHVQLTTFQNVPLTSPTK